MRVGVVGIGGLGQMGVQLAKAMGNTVTAISTTPNKVTKKVIHKALNVYLQAIK